MSMSQRVIIIGPAHPLRGGLADFNERLAQAFLDAGDELSIYTFSLQYPSFLFPGKTQYTSDPAPKGMDIKVKINSVNPLNWRSVGREIAKLKPDLVIVAYWLPFMGPCLGTILRSIKKNKHTKVIALTHNIIPHEKRPGDKAFTKYFVKPVDGYVVLSRSVADDIRQFVKEDRPIEYIPHPIYDNHGTAMPKLEACKKLDLDPQGHYLLFFGFIREYKGLDLLLKAIADPRIKAAGIKAIVAGEFYSDRKPYDELIEELKIADQLSLHTEYIAKKDIPQFFAAADLVVQPYKTATQSGISQLAYHFEKPMVVTNVGGLPEIVPDGKAGYVVRRDPKALADAILKYFEEGREAEFRAFIQEEKKRYSWDEMVLKMKGMFAGHDT
jgi:D-inositol-3-phosphate glycosyltransferase